MTNTCSAGSVRNPFIALMLLVGSVVAEPAPEALSKYMNSIPPSNDFFCVRNGPSDMALHPDRAPYTQLAVQNGVVLFSGTAPQLGRNFSLTAGSLVYSNQMSTLGGPEPSPQVGTAGTLLQQGSKHFLPWSEARWHPGENVYWSGYRATRGWYEGAPYWNYAEDTQQPIDNYSAICPDLDPNLDEESDLHKPQIQFSVNGLSFGLHSSVQLELAPGIYQASKVRRTFAESSLGANGHVECQYLFREPWFQARGHLAAFSLDLGPDEWNGENKRLAKRFYPNYLNIYPYTRLELGGGRLFVDFERAATWPREVADPVHLEGETTEFGEVSGSVVAERVQDQFDNRVAFDRVPDYQWHTDYKVPDLVGPKAFLGSTDSMLANLVQHYRATPNAWRLPHKRLRSVDLYPNETSEDLDGPSWRVFFVYEHPESDRITATDTGDESAWKSIYSDLTQASWGFGRLPELRDQTTLLTVQAYKGEHVGDEQLNVHLPYFQDDYSVWESHVNRPGHKRLNAGIEYDGDHNGDGCPGVCGVDDDGDGLIDEEICTTLPCLPQDNFALDDNEDGVTGYNPFNPNTYKFTTDPSVNDLRSTDPQGEKLGTDGAPGLENVDDDGDGLIDENSNNHLAYLDVSLANCQLCQDALVCGEGGPASGSPLPAVCLTSGNRLRQSHEPTTHPGCLNPLYWITIRTLGETCSIQEITNEPVDPFAHYDDDEDGLIDEDTPYDPLLVNMRMLTPTSACASGRLPFVPKGVSYEGEGNNQNGGVYEDDCRSPLDPRLDPWTYQVQYVYARSNPYWLLAHRNVAPPETTDPTADPSYGTPLWLNQPKYHYFAPFDPDLDGDEVNDIILPERNCAGSHPNCQLAVTEANLALAPSGSEFAGMVIHAQGDDQSDPRPNVHPDCLPDPKYRGPQGYVRPTYSGAQLGDNGDPVAPVKPSDIHLIKRIVRMREDAINNPNNFTEQTWLYRYNDMGFLKAVFEPSDVQNIISAESGDVIEVPDDILKYADTHVVAGLPLINYASQWYTYYNPYATVVTDSQNQVLSSPGISECYDAPPFAARCEGEELSDRGASSNYYPVNACDGQDLWQSDSSYHSEMHVDPDCSPFMRQDCGWCFAREACVTSPGESGCGDDYCSCSDGVAVDANQLAQMGIPGAVPRLRKWMIKTARVRGADNEMHLYRFDYLGAPSSVYDNAQSITSYADPHNITIVDELVEQTPDEWTDSSKRNEFYIYEDDFKLVLDAANPATRPTSQQGEGQYGEKLYSATSHYLYAPVKVKTRRVVTMNYYGIALSDRLIVTPGFNGDQTSLVDNQQYELLNTRGQAKHVYDPSWVATLREMGSSAVKGMGRVYVELFGGHEGWHSVLRGIAWGSAGGNLYDQQCKTPEVLSDVPVQQVVADDLAVQTVIQHQLYDYDGSGTGQDAVKDLVSHEAAFYWKTPYSSLATTDPAMTIRGETPINPTGCNGNQGLDGGADLHDQGSVEVTGFPGADGDEADGTSLVRYHYEPWDDTSYKGPIKWKTRWLEAVPALQGGQGTVAIEKWFFDRNGQIRLYGRGVGNSNNPPDPIAPFYWTYTAYDDFGRLVIQIEDVDPQVLDSSNASLFWVGYDEDIARPSGMDPPLNLVTRYDYDDLGMLKRVRQGLASGSDWHSPMPGKLGHDAIATEFDILANRVITLTYDPPGAPNSEITETVWQDPYMYKLTHQYVQPSSPEDPESDWHSNGTTSVTVMTKDGRFLEERTIARQGEAILGEGRTIIDDFGWGISLQNYSYDGALDNLTINDTPDKLWDSCCPEETPDCETNSPVCCSGGTNGCSELNFIDGDINPEFPGETGSDWPPPTEQRIVTLSRSFKQYRQASTLKPTADIVFREFTSEPTPGEETNDPRTVVRQYQYDLEDRIARQTDPDGTVTRFLFDQKRRLTKIFRGSRDGCLDWFPVRTAPPADDADDDMLLVEHRLYNDGTPHYEYNYSDGSGGGESNEDFPKDANKLVRVRRYTDSAEGCNSRYDERTRSRDIQYTYDWRGRPIIAKEVAVGYRSGGSTGSSDPGFVSAATTIFDNLDRPRFVATWNQSQLEDVKDQVEIWAEDHTTTAAEILTLQPLSLSETRYDDRGRVYNQRTYNVDDTSGSTYAWTWTQRDDLDRVIMQVGPSGAVKNTYDSLGRVLSTSFWTYSGTDDIGVGTRLELTRTETTYDAFGNVLTQAHWDRRYENLDENGELERSEAIVNYTYNWYDSARRLKATANYGSNDSDDGYAFGTAPDYERTKPPTWTDGAYRIDNQVINALVSEYRYDAAGRRIKARDPKGILTYTWYDLLGHTILEAENYDFADSIFVGPTRYTAYHYNRGGQLDMIAAIIPDDPEETLTPADIHWEEESSGQYSARSVSLGGSIAGSVQATSFVYNAGIVNESDHGEVSRAPSQLAQIWYPNETSGQPDDRDSLTFTYTIGGHVAQRTDSREVTLDFEYGGGVDEPPSDQLTGVAATIPNSSGNQLPTIDDSMKYLEFRYDDRQQLVRAATYEYPPSAPGERPENKLSEVTYRYDAWGNLTLETLDPTGDESFAREVSYRWSEPGTNRNRLLAMYYPSGMQLRYNYGAADSATDIINRLTGLQQFIGTNSPQMRDIISYQQTGGGMTIGKVWGLETIRLDYRDRGLDQFGRPVRMAFLASGSTLHEYKYRYDANGNRTSSRIQQHLHNNDRSYVYKYDSLDRLTHASRGALDPDNNKLNATPTPIGKDWNLDILGNWSGDENHSVITYNDVAANQRYDAGTDAYTLREQHDTDSTNEIDRYITQTQGQSAVNYTFEYDAAGSLIEDNKYKYIYDAWNRLVEVKEPDNTLVAKYRYDALGRRINKKVLHAKDKGLLTSDHGDFFYYDGHRVLEHNRTTSQGALSPHRAFAYGINYIDEPVAQFKASEPEAELPYYIIQDVNHNVTAVVDSHGTMAQQYSRDPYGSIFAGEAANGSALDLGKPSTLATSMQHQGLWHDFETGLVYNRGRTYNPALGKFQQRDPASTALHAEVVTWGGRSPGSAVSVAELDQFEDGLSIYQYLMGNPSAYTDPTGENSEDDGLDWYEGDPMLLVERDWDEIYGSIVDEGWAYLGAQGAATWGAFWGGNVASLPTFANGMARVSQGMSDYADFYAEQVMYLPVDVALQGFGSLGAISHIASEGADAARNVRRATDAFDALDNAHEMRLAAEAGKAAIMVGKASKVVRKAAVVYKYTDEISTLKLRGRGFTSGSKKLRALGLHEYRPPNSKRIEFRTEPGNKGKVRAAWDPEARSKHNMGNHWHKFGPDGKTPISDSGRILGDADETAAHIRSMGG